VAEAAAGVAAAGGGAGAAGGAGGGLELFRLWQGGNNLFYVNFFFN